MNLLRTLLIGLIFGCLGLVARGDVAVTETADAVTLDNGLVRLEFSRANGLPKVVSAKVGGEMRRLSDAKARNALYIDWNGGPAVIAPELKAKQPRAGYGGPRDVTLRVVSRSAEVAEVAAVSMPGQWLPFKVEYHFRLHRGERKFYAWAIYSHDKGMAAGDIAQTRFVFRGLTGTELFTHHIVDAKRSGPYNTTPVVETVQDATSLHADGTVHTKYDNSAFTHEYLAHGLWGRGAKTEGDGVGFWLLWPSTEFNNSGPMRQDLTVHFDNTLLAMFQSGHFGAGIIKLKDDEQWSKLCGPVVFYVNEAASAQEALADASAEANKEREAWPYAWLKHPDYALERGEVRGKVAMSGGRSAAGGWAVLSPVEEIDWAVSANGYQFYSRVGADGGFAIPKVRPGKYKLNIAAADEPVDYRQDIEVKAGENDLGVIAWDVPRAGKTLWQVGKFDRTTMEFLSGDDPRNYMRFMDYFKQFPNDVAFTIGTSNEKTDWFYAHWNWYNQTPRRTIRFEADGKQSGRAVLTVGIAAREYASGKPVADVGERAMSSGTLVVRLNGEIVAEFRGGKTGAAGYRSASQDSPYVVERVEFDAAKLKPGVNEISFEHAVSRPIPTDPEELKKLRRPRGSVMYDAIRLEVMP
jgi:rhamnogalacturonan endolyase